MLEKYVATILRLHDISPLSSCAVPLIAVPSETGAPRFKVVPCTEPKTLPPDAVLLIAVLVTMRGDTADIARLHQENSRKLTWSSRGADGKPRVSELPIRMFSLATEEARSKLESSGTLLATAGTPMLVSAPFDGTLGALQTALSATLGPQFAGVLQMPQSFTAGQNHRVNAGPRDDGTIRPDALALTIYELTQVTDSDRSAARERLLQRGFEIQHALSVEELQPGGKWLAAFDPTGSRTISLSGHPKTLRSISAVRSLLRELFERLVERPDIKAHAGTDEERQAGFAALTSERKAKGLVKVVYRSFMT